MTRTFAIWKKGRPAKMCLCPKATLCRLTSINSSVYEANIKYCIAQLQYIASPENKLNISRTLVNVNRIYFFLTCSGSLKEIYMGLFIKHDGMVALRRFQDFVISSKDQFKRVDYDEIRYVLSVIVLHLYKHFKSNDLYEVNSNPFVVFMNERIDGFQEFQNISVQMERDFDEEVVDGREEVVPQLVTSTIVNRNILVKILRRLVFLLDEEFTHLSEARNYEMKFLEIMEMLQAKQINQNEFFEEDKVVQELLKQILLKLLRNMNAIKAEAYEAKLQNNDAQLD